VEEVAKRIFFQLVLPRCADFEICFVYFLATDKFEQKAKKQGEGEKQKNKVKAREIEMRRRQIKETERAKETNATNTITDGK
jgi:hypothetical protein